jgi:hypothetical protein
MTADTSTRVDRELLAKICGMLGSAHDGEIAAAGRAANALVASAGLTWQQILDPPPSEPSVIADRHALIRACIAHWHDLLTWERLFVEAIQAQRKPLGLLQRQLLASLAKIAAARAARAAQVAPTRAPKPRKSSRKNKRRRAA